MLQVSDDAVGIAYTVRCVGIRVKCNI